MKREILLNRRKAFVYDTYARFISTVNAAIKKHDPNHLNLGLRFGGSAPDEIIKASKGFDVFSFNNYGYTVNQNIIKRVYDLTGLAYDHRGIPFRSTRTRTCSRIGTNREPGMSGLLLIAIMWKMLQPIPAIIGTHWFQWIDQPATGRFDGENYNIGFVDVTDRPYIELVNAAKETFKRLFDVHSGKEPPVNRQAMTQ